MRADWVLKPLGDVCTVIGGGTPSKRNSAYFDGDIPWATVRDMKEENLNRTEFKISPEAVKSSATNIIPAGNVVIATRVGLGKVCLLGQDTAINQDLRAVIPKGRNVDVRFMFRWFQSIAHVIESEGTGATVKGVKLPFIKSLRMPIPPLPEQRRIVAILDEAFAGIATAVANTEKNLANARELFESYLNAVFSQRGEGWTKSPLETLVTDSCTLSYGIVQPGSDVRGGLPVVRPTDLREKLIRRETLKTIDPSLAKAYSRTTLHGGDLLLCVRGTTGDLSVAATELEGANVTRGIVPIRFNPSLLNQDLGYHLLKSPFVQDQIAEKTYGAALMQINIKDVRKLLIPVPPRETHEELCSSLDDLSAETDRLQSIYGQKLNALSVLKQSLLQKAFSGELTAGKEASDVIRDKEEVA